MGNETTVKEFYVCSRYEEEITIEFRHKLLTIIVEDIQEHYQLPMRERCEYQHLLGHEDEVN